MNITILGTGNMAKGLASVFAAGGYDVTLGSRDAAGRKKPPRHSGPGSRVTGSRLPPARPTLSSSRFRLMRPLKRLPLPVALPEKFSSTSAIP